ncbi:MAG: hypothetical protein A2V90_01385 [Gammaproteobacteria bacterium RBG_16_57_12]|nr:MAG: hypothetical protein A2V90_01385 [Gammaproteobacteria bacterium RBG_16_57_12]
MNVQNKNKLLTTFLAPALLLGCGQGPEISFNTDIKPIFDAKCIECHKAGGVGEEKSGLNLESYDSLMKGTRFGKVIDPGHSVSSTLVILIGDRADPSIRMPHGDREKLDDAQIALIKQWIDQGAKNN